MQSKTTTFCLLLLCLACTAVGQLTYQTNPNRTHTVGALCSMFESRHHIVDSEDRSEIDQYNKLMSSSFSVSGYLFIDSATSSSSRPSRTQITWEAFLTSTPT